jgi:hypothetical protein
LLGAGFSRNWGGWLASEVFEYLLGCPEISDNPELKRLLWKYQKEPRLGGFENALAEVQGDFQHDPDANRPKLESFQTSITHMFEAMNDGFSMAPFDFGQRHQNLAMSVSTFLTKFDAIFTLNQDLLLEHHYFIQNLPRGPNRGRNGPDLPGMQPIPDPRGMGGNQWVECQWKPTDTEFQVHDGSQPYFKLHGSSNWQGQDGGSMLIMGGNKAREIKLWPILSWYQQQFENYLFRPEARLMVIGYGFRDSHINETIIRAVNEHGLQVFIIGPDGSDQARIVNPTYRGAIYVRGPLDEAFERGLIGASRRSLREIFADDVIEHNKVHRFFAA